MNPKFNFLEVDLCRQSQLPFMELKDKIASAQAIVSICAIFVGGWWTYDNFVKERKHLPHANIDHKVSHIRLDAKTILLRVAVIVSNTGSSQMQIKRTDVRLQQILPFMCLEGDDRCVKNEIAESLKKHAREADVFSWPMIRRRLETRPTPITLEPGETEPLSFEFVIPNEVKAVRIYSHIRNEVSKGERGWEMSSYYELSKPREPK